MFNNSHYSHEQ